MNIQHFKTTFILVSALMIGTVVMHEMHIVPWPAFLAVIFYFLSEFDNKKIPSIMGSGVVGLFFGYGFTFAMPALVESFGPSLGYYIVLGVSLAIVIGMKPIAHSYFNPMTFAYGLLSLLYIDVAAAESFTWLLTHLIGGSFIIGCLYIATYKVLPKLAAE
ncbi:hypothetical protein [Photobacterium rosenbergii]|uniref:DUF1097 domain-containing protein n=1 Tax=Photobacterium rosenbergii TaxID=294936 RepID=A0ABU3ZNS9_9GAMM|nr:hypothetical protein [Photobacterium rosenbergii]MDV5171770.1 hypothetical protein [Photobacterium rosenbergii]